MTVTILNVSDPVYANAEGTRIHCIVTTDEYGDNPFMASPNDPAVHGVRIFNDIMAGMYGEIGAYVPPPPDLNALIGLAATQLDKSDMTVLRCLAVGVEVPQAWIDFRAALRLAIKDPFNNAIPPTPPFPTGT